MVSKLGLFSHEIKYFISYSISARWVVNIFCQFIALFYSCKISHSISQINIFFKWKKKKNYYFAISLKIIFFFFSLFILLPQNFHKFQVYIKNYGKFNSKLVSIFSSRKTAPMLFAPAAWRPFPLEFNAHICSRQVRFIFAQE